MFSLSICPRSIAEISSFATLKMKNYIKLKCLNHILLLLYLLFYSITKIETYIFFKITTHPKIVHRKKNENILVNSIHSL